MGQKLTGQLDHYIVYHCHFELGKLYSQRGENKSAYKHFDVVMTGESLAW